MAKVLPSTSSNRFESHVAKLDHLTKEQSNDKVERQDQSTSSLLLLRDVPPSHACSSSSLKSSLKVKKQSESIAQSYGLPLSSSSSLSTTWDDTTSGELSSRSIQQQEMDEHKEQQSDEEVASSRSIHFSQVHVHYHSIVIGDHPCSMNGPTIALGWERLDSAVYHPLEFEAMRRQRPKDELLMTRKERERMLREAGFSKLQIQQKSMADGKSNNDNKRKSFAALRRLFSKQQQRLRRESF